jgi:hypothetical protein
VPLDQETTPVNQKEEQIEPREDDGVSEGRDGVFQSAGGQKMPSEQIFRSRLRKIWDGMQGFKDQTPSGEPSMASKATETGLSQIEQYTPDNVKALLTAKKCPTITTLESLGWSARPATAGIYAWILKPSQRFVEDEKRHHVRIGVVGLDGELAQVPEILTGPSAWGRLPRLVLYKLGFRAETAEGMEMRAQVGPRSKVVKLLEVPHSLYQHDSVPEGQADAPTLPELLAMGRGVFAIWLGAVVSPSRQAITVMTPWPVREYKYKGLAFHRAMVREPETKEERRTRKQREREERLEANYRKKKESSQSWLERKDLAAARQVARRIAMRSLRRSNGHSPEAVAKLRRSLSLDEAWDEYNGSSLDTPSRAKNTTGKKSLGRESVLRGLKSSNPAR